jgi:hypothetical protein
MGRLLGDIKNSDLIARRSDLKVSLEAVIDSSIHASGTILNRGEVLAKYVPADASVHVGKFRAYAESNTTGAGFANNSVNFTLDPAIRAGLNFLPGDVIEGVTGALALGTIATYNSATGVGTLTGNSTNNLAAGNAVRLQKATWALNNKTGLVLEDELLMEGEDQAVSGVREGFLVVNRSALTTSAISEIGGTLVEANEVRII